MTVHPPQKSYHRQADGTVEELGFVAEDYVSTLVDTFYDRVRKDETLGPIFNAALEGKWNTHLAQMKRFWRSIVFKSREYSGQPLPAHRKHPEISPEHFDIWLNLFYQTLLDTAPSQKVADYFIETAHRIAESLKLALFGAPETGLPRP